MIKNWSYKDNRMREKLKEIRNSNHKSQQEVADALHMARTTYSNYEQGLAEPDVATIKALADYFHTTTDNLLGHNVPYLLDKSTLTPKQKHLVESICTLDDNLCDRIEAYIQGSKDNNG